MDLDDVAKTLQILAYDARTTHGREDTAAEYEREGATLRAAAVRLRKLDAIEPLIAKFRAEWDAAGQGNTPDDDAISAADGFLEDIARIADAPGGTE